jgi:small subunit ribosomal protein S8
MTVKDHVADLLTRVRNGGMARRRYVEIPQCKAVLEIVKILKETGYIEGFLVREEKPQGRIRIYLKYDHQRLPVIQGLRRISRSSQRCYVGYQDIPKVFGGMGTSVLSTSQGILAGEEARQRKIGGELMCYVW